MGLSERKPAIGEVSLERIVRAVEKVRIRSMTASVASLPVILLTSDDAAS